MFCPQCGAQTEQSTKFCKACGLKLTDHARLLEEPREAERMSETQWLRDKRMMVGVIVTLVSLFDLILFFIIFGSIALANPGSAGFQKSGLTMMIVFLLATLLTAGIGVGNLIASGFFRNMRERQLKIELALLERRRKKIEDETAKPPASLSDHLAEGAHITESTTRELHPIAVTNRTLSGE
jgi:hypothetical protein